MQRHLVILTLLAGLLLPAAARADGFVAPKGTIWAKIAYRSWQADRVFAGPNDRQVFDGLAPSERVELGDPIPFDSTEGGEMATRTLEAQVVAVPVERLEVGLYVPALQRVRFTNNNSETITTGTGDLRAHVGYQLTPSGGRGATTLAVRTKIPTTEIETDALAVPLSEGQWDLAVDQTSSVEPIPRLRLTLQTLVRYRAPGRFPDSNEQYKPGNEMVLRGEVGGGPVDWLWLKGGYRGLWSTGWENRESGTASRGDFRSFQEVVGGIYFGWGDLIGGAAEGFALDASVAWPFTGRDYPRGLTWSVGVAWGRRLGGG